MSFFFDLCKIIDPFQQTPLHFLPSHKQFSLSLLFFRSSLKKKKEKGKRASEIGVHRHASFSHNLLLFPFFRSDAPGGRGYRVALSGLSLPGPVLFLLNDESWCDFAWANNQSIYSEDIRRASSGKRLLISFDRSPPRERKVEGRRRRGARYRLEFSFLSLAKRREEDETNILSNWDEIEESVEICKVLLYI